MKNLLKIQFFFIAMLTFFAATAQVTFDGIRIYEHSGFSGKQHGPMGVGTYSEPGMFGEVENDQISSIKIDPGYGVFVFRDDKFGGGWAFFSESVNDLGGTEINDQISSIKVIIKDSKYKYSNHGGHFRSNEEEMKLEPKKRYQKLKTKNYNPTRY